MQAKPQAQDKIIFRPGVEEPEATPEYDMGQSVLTDLMEACRPR